MPLPSLFGDPRIRLAVAVAGIIPAFALTLVVVGRYKSQRTTLAHEWALRGELDMAATPKTAVDELQTALAYGPDDGDERLHLAEALIAAGEPDEARAHLLTLWAEEPGDGRINLDLARLYAAAGDVTAATRYYHAAIDGAWEDRAADARRSARLELAKLLLQKQQPDRAQAELIALVDDLPPDPALITEVGGLLVKAGADIRSIGVFERALALEPHDARAARLEGEVQFRSGRYQLAHELLARARRNGASLDPADDMMLAASGRVPVLDPLAGRLSARTRMERALGDLAIARTKLARCQTASSSTADAGRIADLARQADAFARLSRRRLERDPDQVTDIISLVVVIESIPGSQCGADTPDDRALQLIAAEHRLQTR